MQYRACVPYLMTNNTILISVMEIVRALPGEPNVPKASKSLALCADLVKEQALAQ
jgi:hypothetical protein